ncbi:MAG: Lrp/AsnC family transcriptional regulator [Hyphomonadaceae bacterium]|nr:Lrp/AsnC family transcriptional regulator [Hyphomonadaceae bacterium]
MGPAPPLYAPNGARLDAVDLEILRRVQTDASVQNQVLARELGLSPSGCLKRVRRLEESGVIRGYVAVAEDRVFDIWSLLWIEVKLRRRALQRRDDFEAAVQAAPEVMEAYEVAGRFDYLLKAALPSTAAWSDLRTQLDPENSFIKSVDIFAGLRTTKDRRLHPLLTLGDTK